MEKWRYIETCILIFSKVKRKTTWMVVATIKGFEICRKDTVLKALYSIRMKTLLQNYKYIRVPVGTPIPSHSSTPTRIPPLGRLRTQAEFPSRNSGPRSRGRSRSRRGRRRPGFNGKSSFGCKKFRCWLYEFVAITKRPRFMKIYYSRLC